MKKFIAISATAMLLVQNPLFLIAAENANVKSVRVSADSVYINADRPVQYKAFTTEQPPKLVIELMDSKMQTLQEIPVNSGLLRKVRTGQFQTAPNSVSRVVMELTQKTAYEVTRKGTELVVMLGARAAAAKAPAVKDAAADVAGVKVIVPDAAAPAAERPIEMTLEAAPVKPADLRRESAPVITPKRPAAQAGSRNIIETLSREPISIDYSEADVREVIDMMAAKAGINIIYGDDVSGTVTITLNKVPFDEAFKTLLNMKGLAAQQAGDNILRIAAPSTFIAEQKKAMLQTRVFFLNYAKAAAVKTQVDSVTAAEGRTAKCTADDTNNALIVTDTTPGLDSTERLIRSLDRMPKQVLIEAKLVEVTLDSSFDMGVEWGFYGKSNGNFAGTLIGVDGVNAAGADVVIPKAANAAQGGTGVSLAAKNIYGGLRFGRVTSSYMLDTTITAAAKKGKAKVLSDPKVATLNNKEANINITNQTPYTTTEITNTSGGSVSTTKVTYVTTGIVLRVTPTINSDGRITMSISPSVSQPSQAAAFEAPSVDTRSTDTNVIVKNGETIVIGGLIHDSQSDYVYKVPLLGDIPLLGYLFRKKSVARTRMELLIFVTPKIIED